MAAIFNKYWLPSFAITIFRLRRKKKSKVVIVCDNDNESWSEWKNKRTLVTLESKLYKNGINTALIFIDKYNRYFLHLHILIFSRQPVILRIFFVEESNNSGWDMPRQRPRSRPRSRPRYGPRSRPRCRSGTSTSLGLGLDYNIRLREYDHKCASRGFSIIIIRDI